MESYVLKIASRESGSLLQNKTFVPIEGPYLSISNSSRYKTISIVRAAWSKSGSKIAACDCQGNIYIFNFLKNRFFLAHRLSICCTFMVFSNDHNILIASGDCNIVSLNIDSKTIKNTFNYHTSCVTCISFDKSGDNVLSASKDEAILWNSISFEIIRILSLRKSVEIIKVCFIPNKDIVLSAFKDSSVFLWDFTNFSCISQFLCNEEDNMLNLKAVDCSWDGELIVCAGKSNWFLVWSIPQEKRLYTVTLPENVTVKHVSFLPSMKTEDDNHAHILTILTSEADVCIYNVETMELLHKIQCLDSKIISYATSMTSLQLCTIALPGTLNVYDLEPFLVSNKEEKKRSVENFSKASTHCFAETIVITRKKIKKTKKSSALCKESLKAMLKQFGEYPEKYRFFIWSQILGLPHNVDAFKVLHEESLQISPFVKDYSFMNPGVKKTFLRVMSMLAFWFPVLKEVDFYQCVVFPFIKVLQKNTIICIELLITYISNWCQNWFIFCPFPPFNILCAVENLITYHDKQLMEHFVRCNIPPEIYAWSLLQTSFSEVLNKHQWLKLWDNIFSNPLSYLLYVVLAFNILMKDVLLRCKSVEHFKQCYRKHGISASALIQKAQELQKESPSEIDPAPVMGTFSPLPKGPYPSFMQLSKMVVDLRTYDRKTLIEKEMDYLNQKNILELKSNYLLELQKLQLMRRNMLLETKDIQNSDGLAALSRKLKNVQCLIQENLKDQVSMLKGRIDYNFAAGTEDYETHFFHFKNYLKKLKKENKK